MALQFRISIALFSLTPLVLIKFLCAVTTSMHLTYVYFAHCDSSVQKLRDYLNLARFDSSIQKENCYLDLHFVDCASSILM